MFNQFKKFHIENPAIWKLFERYTYEAINNGMNNYSSKTIFERIRWHVDIETRGDVFKINNNYTAYYSRMFHVAHPRFNGFFRTRAIPYPNIEADLLALI